MSAVPVETVCIAVPGSGGIIGLFVSDRARINDRLAEYNRNGYRLVGFSRAVRTNLVYFLLQLICLAFTLLIWCPAPGGLLFFERSNG